MLLLSKAGRLWLLGLARQAVEAAARGHPFRTPPPPAELPSSDREELERYRAAFVSLHKQGSLRGCVGHTATDLPLRIVVAEMARAAATDDTRFPKVTPDEVVEIEVEISVLSPFFSIQPEQIVPGKHGLLVRRGLHRGLLLPQVAAAHQWTAARLLEETCRKAGLSPDAWKHGASVEAFTADVICDSDPMVA
jgi:AmmeMemoRadiSam system protein A